MRVLTIGADDGEVQAMAQAVGRRGIRAAELVVQDSEAARGKLAEEDWDLVLVGAAPGSEERSKLLDQLKDLQPDLFILPTFPRPRHRLLSWMGFRDAWVCRIEDRFVPLARILNRTPPKRPPYPDAFGQDLGESFQNLLEHTPDAFLLVDSQGRITDANSAAAQLARRVRHRMTGKMFLTLLATRLSKQTLADFSRWLDSGQRLFTATEPAAPGPAAALELTALRLGANATARVLVQLRDISPYRRLEQQLGESREKFQTLVEQLPAITYIVEVNGLIPRAMYVSPQIESILGYSQQEWLQDPTLSYRLLHPEDRTRVMTEMYKNLGRREPFCLEYRKVARDGRVVWFRNQAAWISDEHGELRRVQGVMFDITQQKQAEESARRRGSILEAVRFAGETFLRTPVWTEAVEPVLAKLGEAAEASRVYVFERVSASGQTPILISQRFEWTADGILPQIDNPGLQNAEVEARRFGRLGQFMERGEPLYGLARDFPDEEKPLLQAQQILALAEVPILVGGRWWGFIGFDDCRQERQWLKAEVDALRAAANQLAAAIDRQRAEQALRENQEHLRQSQKMEALGRLAGGIAHDFNNLLTAILGYGRLIQDELGTQPEWQDEINEIIRSGERAAELIRQVLAFGRKQISDIHPVQLNAVVADMDRLLRRTLGEDIELVTLFGEDLESIKADAGQLGQIIMNLAINARDAMPGGGQLVIETRAAEADADYLREFAGLAPGHYVRLAVRDNGCGMSEEIRARAFEPFFTTKELGKGAGMGLATVYGIVQQYEGHVALRSEVGVGTEFTIHFPCLSQPTQKIWFEPDIPLPHGTETILLVEDEHMVRRLAQRILHSLGYRVLEAANGEEALRLAADLPEPLHLVLTDVVMPKMGGPELIQRLQKVRTDFKVLYATGFPGDAVRSPGLQDSRHPVLHKPYTRDSLAMMVRQVLDSLEQIPVR